MKTKSDCVRTEDKILQASCLIVSQSFNCDLIAAAIGLPLAADPLG